MKDCSLGGVFPVAALVIVEKGTGHYGIKFGCHPSFQIAMERTFTEATQGQDIFGYANRSCFDFADSKTSNSMNVYNTYKVGFGHYPYEFFSKTPSYGFSKPKDVSTMSNRELALNWIKTFRSQGYDILIRNTSYLGFPSVHIIIPTFSELVTVDDFWCRLYYTRAHVGKLLMNPERIDEHSAKYIAATLDYLSSSFLENSIDSYYVWAQEADVPFYGTSVYGTYFLSALAYTLMHDYKTAAARMKYVLAAYTNKRILDRFSEGSAYLPQKDVINAMYYYLEGMGELDDSAVVVSFLERFFSHSVIKEIEAVFCGMSNCIAKLLPSLSPEYPQTRSIEVYRQLQHKLFQAQSDNPISQDSIGEIMSQKAL